MVAPYFCNRCKAETDKPLGNCPGCGRRLHKTSTVRGLGWLIFVLGGGLTAFMAWLTLMLSRIIERADEPGATTRFAGDASDALLIYAVLGLVLALGLTFVVAGAWQIVFGRRNKNIVFVALALAAILYAFGWYVRGLS
jgi:hypothetical protein